jgi:hypothetical protein
MLTESDCAVVMLLDAGVTVTVGVVGFWLVVPPPPWLPPPQAPVESAIEERRRPKNKPANRFIEKPL